MKQYLLLTFTFLTIVTFSQEADTGRRSFFVTASRNIMLKGYSSIRYQNFDGKDIEEGMDIRRARLDLSGNLTPFLFYKFLADFAERPKLLDAYAEVRINEYFNITLGQIKVPFSFESMIPLRKFELIDFSQTVDALVSRSQDVIGNQYGRDIGIQLGGTLLKKGSRTIAEYRIALLNGSGINVADTANEAKDFTGRLIVNPVKGFSLGTSFYSGWGKAILPSPKYDGRSQPRNRFGFDIEYTTEKLAVRSEYLHGTDGETEKAGWYAMAGYYIIPSKLQVVGKYDSFDTDRSGGNNITTWYVAGANFNFNAWSRLQAFYTIREEQGAPVSNNYFSIQYTIGF